MVALPVDIYVNGRRIATTDYVGGQLAERVRGTSTATRQPSQRSRDCPHENFADGFAYLDWEQIHWPLRFCRDCYVVLAGRRPRVGAMAAWSREITPDDVIRTKWAKEWPKDGKPRRRKAPSASEWPTGY